MMLGLGVVFISGILTLLLSGLSLDKQIDKWFGWLIKEAIKIPPVPLSVTLPINVTTQVRFDRFQQRHETGQQQIIEDIIRHVLNQFVGEPITDGNRERIVLNVNHYLQRFHLPQIDRSFLPNSGLISGPW